MLAIGRILRTGARFLMLDEPTEGLAPVIVQQIGATIRRLKAEPASPSCSSSRASGSPRPWRTGTTSSSTASVVDMVPAAELDASMDRLHVYLGV